eukprot:TRINITY_DN2772_c1_g1_i1.p1 TRINITY_DN2772_c1_g1~~TRINITY_DN2772_c1_g1_i1.p1  ORF type:complete len:508 (+),score=63.43 TRINITY_DN2772_c1_g1_i1:99-1622(+)
MTRLLEDAQRRLRTRFLRRWPAAAAATQPRVHATKAPVSSLAEAVPVCPLEGARERLRSRFLAKWPAAVVAEQPGAQRMAAATLCSTTAPVNHLEEARRRISLRAKARWPQLRDSTKCADVPDDEVVFQSSMPSSKPHVGSLSFTPRHLPPMLPTQHGLMNSLRGVSTVRPVDSTPEAYPRKGSPLQTVTLIGAPICEGQTLTGVDLAPDAFRQAGLQRIIEQRNMQFTDFGNVGTDAHDQSQSHPQNDSPVKNSWVIGKKVGELHHRAKAAAAKRNFVLTIGGDHSIASGSITGVHAHNPDLAVIWVDAHGDCNTPESSESKNYHGMPLAHVLGWFKTAVPGFEWCDQHLSSCGPLPESRVALVGIRDLDSEERRLVKQSGLNVFTMSDIDCFGIGQVMEMALACVDHAGQRPLHLSFDVDAIDPAVAPGTGTRARGGLSYREAHYICERVAETSRLVSMDLVEVNPALEEDERELLHGDDPNITGSPTVSLGIELINSALGKAIL